MVKDIQLGRFVSNFVTTIVIDVSRCNTKLDISKCFVLFVNDFVSSLYTYIHMYNQG